MNVKDLQQFLHSLQQPLSTAGAKTVANELDRVCAGLEPFASLSVAQFADFLARAESYARTGVVPAAGGRASAARGAAKTIDAEAVRAATEHMKSLYERAITPEVDYATIAAEVRKLDKQFGKDAVLAIARGFGISGTLRTKKAALQEIERRMAERRESHERTQF